MSDELDAVEPGTAAAWTRDIFLVAISVSTDMCMLSLISDFMRGTETIEISVERFCEENDGEIRIW